MDLAAILLLIEEAEVGTQAEFLRCLADVVNAVYGTAEWPALLAHLSGSPRARQVLEDAIHDPHSGEVREAAARFMRSLGHNIWWNPNCELTRVPCGLCGADQAKVLFTRWGLPIVQCRRCRLVYANPRPSLEHVKDRYSESYFKTEYIPSVPLGEHGEGSVRYHHERLLPLRPYRRMGRILDVGCATGFFLVGAREDGWHPYGVEISDYAIEYGRRQLGLENLSTSVTGFPDEFFDAVTLWETIEHLDDPLSTLREVHRLVGPGGVLALSTPNLDSLCFRLIGGNWWPIMPFEHLYYFNHRTLEKMLARAGFKVKETRYENFDVGKGLTSSGHADYISFLLWRVGPDMLSRWARLTKGGGTIVIYAERARAPSA